MGDNRCLSNKIKAFCEYSPEDGYVFNTLTEEQRTFIEKVRGEGIKSAVTWLKEVQGDIDFSHPSKLLISWQGDKNTYLLEISENEDFSDARRVECNKNSYEVDNLKIGTKYYWRVDGGEAHWFETVDCRWRFVNIDGLRNTRDLGGRKIRQGLLYRGCEVTGDDFNITPTGLKAFQDELGVKSVLDLRVEWLGKYEDGAYIPGILLKQVPYRPYIEAFEEKHRLEIAEIMSFLSDENNYPVYFHCMGGADRTGTVAFFLGALAGELEEDLFLDYELTCLAKIYNPEKLVSDNFYRYRTAEYFSKFLNELKKYAPEEDIGAQVYAFLLDCGVSAECLDKIVSIIKK